MKPAIITLAIFFSFFGISLAEPGPIYHCYGTSNIFHIDVYQEKLANIVAFINTNFRAKVTITSDLEKELVSVRCEARWLDVLYQISAQNNLELLKNDNGWILKRKGTIARVSQEASGP
jgi:hypothetical protein